MGPRALLPSLLLALFLTPPGIARASSVPGQVCELFGLGGIACTPDDCQLSGTLTADCDGAGDDAGGDDKLRITGATVH